MKLWILLYYSLSLLEKIMKTKPLAVAAAFVIVFLLLSPSYSESFEVKDSLEAAFLKYEVMDVFVGELRHTIRIANPWQTSIRSGKLIVPVIKNQTGRHYAVLYNISTVGEVFHGPTFLNYGSGNIYICWSDITIGPEKTFTVELSYLILSFNVRYLVNSSMLANYDVNSELYRWYTQPEQFIQSDDPKIVGAAHEIVGQEMDPHKKALLIYNFVIEHLRYEVQKEEKGALWALENGVGDCSEYSYLFVALCRAAGIPARIQAGFAFHKDSEVMEDGHMWAEYYLEKYGWIPVDAAWKMFDQIDYRHMSSIQSIPEIPYANYIFNQTSGKRPSDKQTAQLKPASPSSFHDSQFAENLFSAVERAKTAEFGVFLGKLLGAGFLFPHEVRAVELKILESKICVQEALDVWETNPTVAVRNA
ncbi:MAG: transglutaminase-like domain-containing protein, partial [Candidatus Bathyarchaeia archaeon]